METIWLLLILTWVCVAAALFKVWIRLDDLYANVGSIWSAVDDLEDKIPGNDRLDLTAEDAEAETDEDEDEYMDEEENGCEDESEANHAQEDQPRQQLDTSDSHLEQPNRTANVNIEASVRAQPTGEVNAGPTKKKDDEDIEIVDCEVVDFEILDEEQSKPPSVEPTQGDKFNRTADGISPSDGTP